jgi:undecaprenyl-diphosphatase
LTREGAARFSFLLATPIIIGAAAYNILKMVKMVMKGQPLQDPIGILAIGFIVSAIVGYAAIAGLLSYLKKKSMAPFVIYLIAFGLLIIFVAVTR